MNILVVNGPNLNMLGLREPEIYGSSTYADLLSIIRKFAEKNNINVLFFQSNHEGEIIDFLQNNYLDYPNLVINPGAFTHYSYSIYDAIKACQFKAVEVHISNIFSREPFRKISVIKDACIAQISGKGFEGYIEAIEILRKESSPL